MFDKQNKTYLVCQCFIEKSLNAPLISFTNEAPYLSATFNQNHSGPSRNFSAGGHTPIFVKIPIDQNKGDFFVVFWKALTELFQYATLAYTSSSPGSPIEQQRRFSTRNSRFHSTWLIGSPITSLRCGYPKETQR